MSAVPGNSFDPSKINGMYPLLAAFLLVVESLLGFWFFKAGDGAERITAGSLMTLTLLAFLFAFYLIFNKKDENETTKLPGLGMVNPAAAQATVEQISSPEPENYIAPNRSYIINRPPKDWNIKELGPTEWVSQNIGITDTALAKNLWGESSESKDIVIFETKISTSVIPIPGTTTIDGRKYLTALEIPAITRLTILPLDRAQPPLFVERSLIHNFTLTVGQFLGLVTLNKQSSTTISNTQRQKLVAELSQVIDNAVVNGQEGKGLTLNIIIIGIEGDVQDYILIMQYPSLKDSDDPELSRNLQTLNEIVSSFRPIKVPNYDARIKELREKADQDFETLMKSQGENLFIGEFRTGLFKLSGKDLSDLDNRTKAIKLLKPFVTFAKEVNFEDEELDELWKSLEVAEEGKTSNFKENLEKLIEVAKNVDKEEGAASGDEEAIAQEEEGNNA